MRDSFHMFLLCAMLFVTPAMEAVHKDNVSEKEYKIKAALIYNFLKFVEGTDRPVVTEDNNAEKESPPVNELLLGIVANKEVYKCFGSLDGKKVGKRKIRVIRLVEKDLRVKELDLLKSMEVLYFSKQPGFDNQVVPGKILSSLGVRNILSIGEEDGFLEAGGIINFIKKENHVGFEINLYAARMGGLKIKTSVLRLAEKVIQENPVKDDQETENG